MITKREPVIAILAFCLAATLFTVLPAGSNYKTSGTGQYDPWLDSNDDGRINILDLIEPAGAFGTFGDPTKNVNVTNWPYELNTTVTNMPYELNTNVTNWPKTQNISYEPPYKVIYFGRIMLSSGDWEIRDMDWCFTGGYSRISIRVQVGGYYVPSGYWAHVCYDRSETAFDPNGLCASLGDYLGEVVLARIFSEGPQTVFLSNSTETQGPYYRPWRLYLDTNAPYPQYWTWVTFDVYLYLRNE